MRAVFLGLTLCTVDAAKAQFVEAAKQKQKEKKVAELDQIVKDKARELSVMKFRSTLVVMVSVIGLFWTLSK
jgi:uncharacterized membrane protein (DUF106 family)